jgi:hypothetical protein
LPDDFDGYFDKIQQVDVLALSCTQINFSRVEMPQPIVVDGRTIYPTSMKIFKDAPDEVYTLPANQVFGEGIFFSFNEERLNAWLELYKSKFTSRYKNDEQHESIYDSLYYKMQKGGSWNSPVDIRLQACVNVYISQTECVVCLFILLMVLKVVWVVLSGRDRDLSFAT